MEKIYQTIIIGAGPAGLIAGQYLEDALILDKKQEIGKPIQCVGMSKGSLVIQGMKPHSSWARSKIYKVERIMPNGKRIGRMHKEYIGYVVEKAPLERFLVRKTKAEIKLNRRVIVLKLKNGFWEVKTSKGELFKSKYIIGADGFNSVVRREIFGENKNKLRFVSGLEASITTKEKVNPEIIRIYLDNERYVGGYGWVFPKSIHTANIGVGGEGNLQKKLDIFLEREIKRDYGNYQISATTKGVTCTQKPGFKFSKLGVMLVGDAAGLNDPIFKAGTNQAMISGKIAARCILENEVPFYEGRIKSMPFSNPKILKGSKILYSLDNQTLNELGELLEGRGFSYIKTLPAFTKILHRASLRKDIFKLFKFLSVWKHNQDYLW